MRLMTPAGAITLCNEPHYCFCSTENVRQYPYSCVLESDYTPSCVHGVLLADCPLVIFAGGGGSSAVHQHSLLLHEGCCYLAVGCHVVKFSPAPFVLHWARQVDPATCFGVHARGSVLIAHGELSISRFSPEGEIRWSCYGADIFSGTLRMLEDEVQISDFYDRVYRFGFENGEELP